VEREYVSLGKPRPLPPEFAIPQVKELLVRGKAAGQLSSADVGRVFEQVELPLRRMKAVLRSLSEEGVTVMVSADESGATKPARKAVAAATTARGASTKAVADPGDAPASPAKERAAKAPAKKAARPAAKKAAVAAAPDARAAAAAPAAPPAGTGAGEPAAPVDGDAEVDVLALEEGPPPEDVAREPGDEAAEEFVLADDDDADEPAQQVATAGATADPVKDYLKQIGKVALLNAEQEVELAKRIEAGLFAEEKLNSGEKFAPRLKRELDWIAEDGRRAKNHLLEANLRLVVSLAEALHRSRHALPRPDPGGQPRPDPGGREVRLHQGLQVLDLRDVVDPPGDHRGDGRPGPHHPHPGAHGRGHQQARPRAAADAAGPRPRADPGGARQGARHDPEKVVEVQKYGREPISLHTPLGEDGDSEFGDLIEDSEAVVPADACRSRCSRSSCTRSSTRCPSARPASSRCASA
jgi:RNA polymerase primary sigma factor